MSSLGFWLSVYTFIHFHPRPGPPPVSEKEGSLPLFKITQPSGPWTSSFLLDLLSFLFHIFHFASFSIFPPSPSFPWLINLFQSISPNSLKQNKKKFRSLLYPLSHLNFLKVDFHTWSPFWPLSLTLQTTLHRFRSWSLFPKDITDLYNKDTSHY